MTDARETEAELLGFRQRALASGEREAARAALKTLVSQGAGPDAWCALHQMEAQDGRWTEALRIAEAAEQRHPEDVGAALLRPGTLPLLGRLEQARAAYRDVAGRFPEDVEGLQRLVQLSQDFDPVTTFWAVGEALRRGLADRDRIVLHGVAAAFVLGEFEAARAFCGRMADPGLAARTLAQARDEEAEWLRLEAEAARSHPHGFTTDDLWALSSGGEKDLAAHLTWRRLLADHSAGEHAALHELTHTLGWHRTVLIYYAASSSARFPDDPLCMLNHVSWLLNKAGFEEAGAILTRPELSGVQPELVLDLKTFCCAGGGLDRATLVQALSESGDGAERARALARSYLRNSSGDDGLMGSTSTDALNSESKGAAEAPLHSVRRRYRPAVLRRPRVALCISGQLRSFRQTWPSTRAAVAEWSPTIFVSTWHDLGTGFGSHDTVDRCLPSGVRQRLPEALRKKSRFETLAPHCLTAMAQDSAVDAAQLSDAYGTPFVRVHDESAFERACADKPGLDYGGWNQAKMFFTLHDVNAQKARHEAQEGFVFDAVLRIRPDKLVETVGAEDIAHVMRERVLLTDYFLGTGVGDQHNLCSSEVADLLGDIWPGMERAGHTRFFPGASGRFAEFLMAEYLIHHGVQFARYAASFSHGITPLEAEFGRLWPAILADMAERGRPEGDAQTLYTAFLETAAELYFAGRAELIAPLLGAQLVLANRDLLSERARAFLDRAADGA